MRKTERFIALDVFRGMTVAFMILVNTPGSWSHIYSPLRHAAWHGCTPTDLVFPFFLFVVGTSMFFSFSKYQNKLNKETLLKIAKRTLLIFVIGLFINSFPQWDTDYSQLRIMAVLQRIALAYGLAALLVLSFSRKGIALISVAVLFIYWGLLYFLGGADPYSLAGNITSTVDAAILGQEHIYTGFGIPFDPEGLFSTIPAVITVILGYFAGMLISKTERNKVPLKLAAFGAIFIFLGWLWGLVLPINKPLWTSSYVLYTGGIAALFFALLIYIIDLKKHKKWTSFFIVFGMNPLFIYALSELWEKTFSQLIVISTSKGENTSGSQWLYQEFFVPFAGNLNGSLLYALTHIFFFWLIGYVLYKKKIFIKV